MLGRPLFLCLGIFLLCSFSSFAVEANLYRLDSIGVQKIGNQTFILHQVVGQETLFSISRRYKVPMVAIQEANEVLKQGMKDGQTILVPFGPSSSSEPLVATLSAPTSSAPTNATVPSKVVENSINSTEKVEVPVVTAQSPSPTKSTPTESTPTTPSKSPESTTLALKTTHKIVRGESLFAIANKYKVTIAELKEWNSLTSNKVLVGQSLKIFASVPVDTSKTSAEPLASASKVEKKEEAKKEEPKIEQKKLEQPKAEEKKVEQPKEVKESPAASMKEEASAPNSMRTSGEWITHTVRSGESLFSLSKQYGSSIEDLIQWNALTSNNLKVGQSIKVGKSTSTGAVQEVGEVKNQPATASSQPVQSLSTTKQEAPVSKQEVTAAKQEVSTPNTSGGFTNTKETGLAELIPGTESNKKYLVLHRTAPVGSVIRVKNEENNLTIFARVVGVLPETGDNSKVLIKLSQAAFEQLKGVNARFPVEILY
jgi:LysM repeat protein